MKVRLHNGESIDSLIKRFKNKVEREQVLLDLALHRFYYSKKEKKLIKEGRYL